MIRSNVIHILLFTALNFPLLSWGQIHIMIDVPSGNHIEVSDLWKIQLISESTDTLNIQLRGSIQELQKGLLYQAWSSGISLIPGEKKSLTKKDLEPIRLLHISPGLTSDRGSPAPTLPNGNYRLCITAINTHTADKNGKDCIQINLASESAPLLISPANMAEISGPAPEFAWTKAKQDADTIYYEIRIYRINPENTENPPLSGEKPWFRKSGIRETRFIYPHSSKELRPSISTGTSRKSPDPPYNYSVYAWTISVYCMEDHTLISRSEPSVFMVPSEKR